MDYYLVKKVRKLNTLIIGFSLLLCLYLFNIISISIVQLIKLHQNKTDYIAICDENSSYEDVYNLHQYINNETNYNNSVIAVEYIEIYTGFQLFVMVMFMFLHAFDIYMNTRHLVYDIGTKIYKRACWIYLLHISLQIVLIAFTLIGLPYKSCVFKMQRQTHYPTLIFVFPFVYMFLYFVLSVFPNIYLTNKYNQNRAEYEEL